ncbi:MAG: flagellar export chaperone FliS [Epulopiscium sp.]|nr:flagellar export chaperone FliS [Candidatus Epulonipiscium sp.]
MIPNNPYQTYRNNAILTATKEELTLMLYDGALKFCNQNIKALEDKDFEAAHVLNMRVQDIIQEFQLSLDDQYEISESFVLLYDYLYRRTVEGNIQKDKEIMEEVRGLLKELRDTWKEAMQLAKKRPMAQAIVNE